MDQYLGLRKQDLGLRGSLPLGLLQSDGQRKDRKNLAVHFQVFEAVNVSATQTLASLRGSDGARLELHYALHTRCQPI